MTKIENSPPLGAKIGDPSSISATPPTKPIFGGHSDSLVEMEKVSFWQKWPSTVYRFFLNVWSLLKKYLPCCEAEKEECIPLHKELEQFSSQITNCDVILTQEEIESTFNKLSPALKKRFREELLKVCSGDTKAADEAIKQNIANSQFKEALKTCLMQLSKKVGYTDADRTE